MTTKTRRKTRSIEMYVGIAEGGGDSGSWATEYVEIPRNTPASAIEKTAEKAMRRKLMKDGTENVALVGVYHIPSPDEDFGEEEEDDR
jgi:hypothetical protein